MAFNGSIAVISRFSSHKTPAFVPVFGNKRRDTFTLGDPNGWIVYTVAYDEPHRIGFFLGRGLTQPTPNIPSPISSCKVVDETNRLLHRLIIRASLLGTLKVKSSPTGLRYIAWSLVSFLG